MYIRNCLKEELSLSQGLLEGGVGASHPLDKVLSVNLVYFELIKGGTLSLSMDKLIEERAYHYFHLIENILAM